MGVRHFEASKKNDQKWSKFWDPHTKSRFWLENLKFFFDEKIKNLNFFFHQILGFLFSFQEVFSENSYHMMVYENLCGGSYLTAHIYKRGSDNKKNASIEKFFLLSENLGVKIPFWYGSSFFLTKELTFVILIFFLFCFDF